MKVFLTGATGYIGRVVAEYLQKAKHTVTGLARSVESAANLRDLGVEPHLGDLRDAASLRAAAASADAVIHAAIAWGPGAGAIDGQAVRAIQEGLRGSPRLLVYTSGVWVIGDTQGRVAGELTRLHPPAVVAWRPAVEQLALETGTVVRAASVFGRGGGRIGEMVRHARENKVIRVVGNGGNHWSFVHVDALADLYVRIVQREPRGELFLAADGPAVTVRTVADTVAAMNDSRVEIWPLDEARKELGPVADALVMDQRIMSTKAGRLLGWGPKWPFVLDEIRSGTYVEKS
ncbi:MAG TPA: NAD-dependent epimerase/dehydratase family protein [Bryobacteraceae bacterium]|nr:NAD-dependent epimerase/dehydratase family protein [Bryobacteraceae bacterium]